MKQISIMTLEEMIEWRQLYRNNCHVRKKEDRDNKDYNRYNYLQYDKRVDKRYPVISAFVDNNIATEEIIRIFNELSYEEIITYCYLFDLKMVYNKFFKF